MTDHDPNEATVFGGPAVPPPPGPATGPMTPVEPGAPPPPGATGGTPVVPGPPPPGGMDPRLRWALVALGVALLALLLVLLLGGDDDDDEITTGSSTTVSTLSTTTSSTTSTTLFTTTSTTAAPTTTATAAPTTTTAAPTTTTTTTATTAPTTTAPPPTIDPDRCTGLTDPDDPEPTAQTFYESWRIGDEGCAREIATDEAVETLFDYPPNGPEWVFQGCTEEEAPDPHVDCAYTYEGGSAHFLQNYGEELGWNIFEVSFIAD